MAVTRLISAVGSEIKEMTAKELKTSIRGSEGRVVMTQFFTGSNLVGGVTNAELQVAFGSDMIMLNGFDTNKEVKLEGFSSLEDTENIGRVNLLKQHVSVPVGVYLECGDPDVYADLEVHSYTNLLSKGRMASKENLLKVKEEGADFVVLAGNPGSGTTYQNIIDATKVAKEVLKDDVLIFAGKWEDGVVQPVLGDPLLGLEESKRICKELIDAGADVITLSMPGARTGITVEDIRDITTFIHTYKPGTLVLSFLDGTIEGADEQTVRDCTILSKQTGADIHCIGDAGLHGTAVPENIYAMSIATKGRLKTWFRQSASKR